MVSVPQRKNENNNEDKNTNDTVYIIKFGDIPIR